MPSKSVFSSLGSLDGFSSSDDEDNGTPTINKPNEEESLVVPELKKGDADNNVIAAKRRRTLIALNDDFLLAPSGLTSLKKDYFDSFTCNLQHDKQQGYSTNELGNLNRMFATYEKWAGNISMKQGGLPVFPKEAGNWDEFVDKLERIKKVQLRKKLHHMRIGIEDSIFAVPPMPIVPTVLDAPQNNNSSSTLAAASALSEETKRLIDQKREEALRRRRQQQLASPPCSPSVLDATLHSCYVGESPAHAPPRVMEQQSQASTLKWDDEDFDVKYQQQQQPKPTVAVAAEPSNDPRPVVDSQAPTQKLDSPTVQEEEEL